MVKDTGPEPTLNEKEIAEMHEAIDSGFTDLFLSIKDKFKDNEYFGSIMVDYLFNRFLDIIAGIEDIEDFIELTSEYSSQLTSFTGNTIVDKLIPDDEICDECAQQSIDEALRKTPRKDLN